MSRGSLLVLAAGLLPEVRRGPSEGPRYHTCFSVDASGKHIPIMNWPLLCNMLEFEREDCERMR